MVICDKCGEVIEESNDLCDDCCGGTQKKCIVCGDPTVHFVDEKPVCTDTRCMVQIYAEHGGHE